MLKKCSYFLCVYSLLVVNIFCQSPNSRCKWVQDFNQQFVLDSLSVDAESITFPEDSTLSFEYDYSSGTVIVHSSKHDSVQVCYKVFPFAFHRTHARYSLNAYDSGAFFKPSVVTNKWVDKREELFTTNSLYKTGSISRGISFGNNQDVFVNSSLNLQMEGKLTNDVNISAVITDQNIPFQPEGNTQQLQDFDRVFIRLFNEKFSLSAGDVVLQHQGNAKGESYFLQYYKNVQGGRLETNYLSLNGKATSSLGVSIAKGKFSSYQITPLEGVQGPYKVQGPDNQRFVIIIAGSEKVFVDGKLLTRGFNHDYVVDYNLGEITFTNRVLITKFTRIRVDFEFSDQNYSKSIVEASHKHDWGKTQIFVNAYSEKDNENRPLAFDLSQEDKQRLSEIGDNTELAVVSGIDSIGYSENRILYKLVDTVDAVGRQRSILVFSTHPDSAVYQGKFTEVGPARGDYLLMNNTLNGRVFEWVGVEEDGTPRGDYTSNIRIATPQKKQMVTVGVVQDLSPNDFVYAEAAFSEKDLNLYSDLDNEDNNGKALKVGFRSENKPIADGSYFINSKVEYEFTSKYFSPIDRFRYVEFDRDWSLNSEEAMTPEQDHIINAEIELRKDLDNLIKYSIVRRKKGDLVDGFQHGLELAGRLGNFYLRSDLYNMSSDKLQTNSNWFRWTVDAFYKTKGLIPGYRYQIDRNEVSLVENDSIVGSAMHFSAHSFYLRSVDSAATRFMLDFNIREDRLPIAGAMVPQNRSQTARVGLGTDIGKNQRVDLLFTYRNLENINNVTESRNEENVTARVDWQGNFLDRHIISELNYQAGNGRELRREFIFIQVPTGEGTHTWRDENQDGVQDLNEFYLALNPDERNYAKIFTPTDEYILAFSNTLNYRLNLEMPRNWKSASGFKGLLAKISSQTSLNIQRKITDDRFSKRFSPFAKDISADDLISSKDQFRSTWFFNRANSKYGLDFSKLLLKNKHLLMDGFEAREINESQFSIRYNPQRTILLRLFTLQRTKEVASDFLESRNYLIRENSITPELAWQPSNNFRLSGKYTMSERKNVLNEGNGESANVNEFTMELRHSKAQRSMLNANVTYTSIKYIGDVNTAVGYELLQALQPGNNMLWGANWQLKIAAGLQLQLHYNGRKSPGAAVIHTGRMQVNALF